MITVASRVLCRLLKRTLPHSMAARRGLQSALRAAEQRDGLLFHEGAERQPPNEGCTC